MTTNEIIDRILSETNLSMREISLRIGANSNVFCDLRNGKVKRISHKLAEKINAAFPQFSITWLLTGEGDMYASGNSAPVFQNSGDNVSNHQGQPQDSGVVVQLIDLLKQKDEQMSRLIGVIERLSGGDGGQG